MLEIIGYTNSGLLCTVCSADASVFGISASKVYLTLLEIGSLVHPTVHVH
jgi:hypothetical protein